MEQNRYHNSALTNNTFKTLEMKIEQLMTYQNVVEHLNKNKRKKHLLIGNGFSMDFERNIFSYHALSKFIEKNGDQTVSKLFERLKTKNFEQIMRQLEQLCEIGDLFTDDKTLVPKIKDVTAKLKISIIDALKELHPENAFTIPEEKSESCMYFLQEYLSKEGLIFSTNYDLLLYWVLMRYQKQNVVDGFGRDIETNLDSADYISPENFEYSKLRWGKYKHEMTVFHLHGTLPIFDTGIHIEKVESDDTNNLLEKIKERIYNEEYPVFVTAGNGNEKLNHIMHNKYLNFCYDKLCAIEDTLVTFGFNFGEYDYHIIDAINKASKMGKKSENRLCAVYIGVYTDENLKYINEIKDKFKCKVTLYNARTANIWNT